METSAQASAPAEGFQEHGSQEDHRSRFSEKVAVMATYQYDGDKGGAQWRLMIRQYLISRAPEMEIILQAVDSQEDRSAMTKELAPAVPILSLQLVQKLSRDLWGFLTLNLQGNARLLLNNSATLEGFELWRRLMKGIRSRSEIRRHELQGKLQRPEAAKSISDIPLTLEKWDSLLREYLESGGRRLSFEERRAALLMLLPQKFREEVFFRIPEMQAVADYALSDDAQDAAVSKLRSQVQRQAELMVQWSAMNGRQEPAHMLGGGDSQYGGDPYWDAPYEEYNQDLLYGAKGWRTKGKGKGKGKDGGKGGKGGKGKDAGPPLCANCGKEGHTVAQCKLPMKPWSERPCHRCGKNGHLSFNCPEKPKPAHVVDEPAAEVEPAKHIWMLTQVASNHCCVSPVKLTNKFAPLDNEEELPDLCSDGPGHQCGCSGQQGLRSCRAVSMSQVARRNESGRYPRTTFAADPETLVTTSCRALHR